MVTFATAYVDDEYPHIYIVEYFLGNDPYGMEYDVSDCTLWVI